MYVKKYKCGRKEARKGGKRRRNREGRKMNQEQKKRECEAKRRVGGGETERYGDKQQMTKTDRGRANKRKSVCVCVRERHRGRGACSVMCNAACGWASVQSNPIQVAPAAVSQNPITVATPFLWHTQHISSCPCWAAFPNQTQWMSHSILWYTFFSAWPHHVRFRRIAKLVKFFIVFPWRPAAGRRGRNVCTTIYYISCRFDQHSQEVLRVASHFYSSSHLTSYGLQDCSFNAFKAKEAQIALTCCMQDSVNVQGYGQVFKTAGVCNKITISCNLLRTRPPFCLCHNTLTLWGNLCLYLFVAAQLQE